MYLSQLELLKEIQLTSINRYKSKEGVAITAFTRPHLLVFQDKHGVKFVLKPGSKIFEELKYLHFNDEEGDEGHMVGDIIQVAFNDMAIDQIEKEYGQVERIVSLDEAIANECKDHQIP